MYLIVLNHDTMAIDAGLNPYSNGTMYLIRSDHSIYNRLRGLNPYSNGTMYLIMLSKVVKTVI